MSLPRTAAFLLAASLASSLLSGNVALARCAPKHTLRIVTSLESDVLPADHFGRRPRTLYRSGQRFGRTEEERNPETNLHMLIVVNEPDVWIADRVARTGRHVVDPGPTFNFRAPIVQPPQSEYWNNFEFGCELPFMEAVGTQKAAPEGSSDRIYEHQHEGITARLVVAKNGIPKRVTVETDEGTYSFVYESFEQITEPDPTLFEKPAGVAFTEAEPE